MEMVKELRDQSWVLVCECKVLLLWGHRLRCPLWGGLVSVLCSKITLGAESRGHKMG